MELDVLATGVVAQRGSHLRCVKVSRSGRLLLVVRCSVDGSGFRSPAGHISDFLAAWLVFVEGFTVKGRLLEAERVLLDLVDLDLDLLSLVAIVLVCSVFPSVTPVCIVEELVV